MLFKLAGIERESIVDGPGIRLAVFFQGCDHKCLFCHNPKSWEFDGGTSVDTQDIIEEYKANPLYKGITLTGGDPVYQASAALELTNEIHKLGGNVWLYTGFTMKELLQMSETVRSLVNSVDAIVDGPFMIEYKDLSLRFRGSSNQHIYERVNGVLVRKE